MKKYRILEVARAVPVLAVVVFWIVSCSGNRVSKAPFEDVKAAVAETVVMDEAAAEADLHAGGRIVEPAAGEV